MSGVNKFSGEDQEKPMSSNIIGPLPKKSVSPCKKVEKASSSLDDIKAPVVTIH